MADYGLKVWDASGNVRLDTTDYISRLVYLTTVSAGQNGNVTLPEIDGKLTAQWAWPIDPQPTSAWKVIIVPHIVTRNGTTISWAYNGPYPATLWYPPGHDETDSEPIGYQSSDSVVQVFLYD